MPAVPGDSIPKASPSPFAADPVTKPSTALVPVTKKPINTRYSRAEGEAIAWDLIFSFLSPKDQCAGSGVCVDWHNRAVTTRELRGRLVLGALQATPTLIKDFQGREDESSVIFASNKWLGVRHNGDLLVSDNQRTFADTPQRLPGITDPWVSPLGSHNHFAFFQSGANYSDLPNFVIINTNTQAVTRISVNLALKGNSIPGDKSIIACIPEDAKHVLAITNTGGIVRIDLSTERPTFTYVGRPVLPIPSRDSDSSYRSDVELSKKGVGKMGNILFFDFSGYHTAFFDLTTGQELATKDSYDFNKSRTGNGTLSFLIQPGEQATLSADTHPSTSKWKIALQTDQYKRAMEEIVAANARWVVLYSKSSSYGEAQHKYRLLSSMTGKGIAGTQILRGSGMGYADPKVWLLEDWFITNAGNKLLLLHVPTNTESELIVTPPNQATTTVITDVKLLDKEILVLFSYNSDQPVRGLQLIRYELPKPPSKTTIQKEQAAQKAAAASEEAPAAPPAPALPTLAAEMPRLEPRTVEQLSRPGGMKKSANGVQYTATLEAELTGFAWLLFKISSALSAIWNAICCGYRRKSE